MSERIVELPVEHGEEHEGMCEIVDASGRRLFRVEPIIHFRESPHDLATFVIEAINSEPRLCKFAKYETVIGFVDGMAMLPMKCLEEIMDKAGAKTVISGKVIWEDRKVWRL